MKRLTSSAWAACKWLVASVLITIAMPLLFISFGFLWAGITIWEDGQDPNSRC